MTANNTNTAVLVTGGFHSPGMAKKLQRAGFTVISFTPKIEKIDASHGSAYLSVFSQEKTPLEKMFQGQKLFLAQNPAGGLNMAPAELPAGVAAADARNGASFSIIESDARDVLEELTRLGLSQGAISVPKVEVQVSGTQLHVNVEIVEEGNTRKVRYTVAFDEEGRYYKVDSAEVLDLNGRIVETAREYAPAAAREMLDRVNGLFNLGHSEAIAEIPIMSGLPGMTLAEIIWVLNLHRGRNVDPLDLATRIVKIELLRQLSLIAEAGRWVVNPTIAQGLLGSSLSVISEASRAEGRETEIAKAVAHYVLNYRSDGSSRPGLLNIDEWSVVFPSLDRSHMRNVILKRMLPQWLGRAPTEQEMDAVIAEALNRKINPAELLKQNWKQPDLIREWVQESQLATSGQGSFQGNDFPSLEQTRQMNFADKMRFIPLVFQEMARLALAGQWKIRKKPGIPLGQGEPVIDETKRQNWHDNYQKKASDLNLLLKFGLLPLDGENVEDWYERVAEIRAQIQQEAMGLHRNGDREGERALQNESRQIQEFVELLLADSHTPEGGFKEQNAQEIVLDFYHFESFYGHFLGVASGGTPAQIKEESLPSENGRIDNAVRPFSVADQSRSPYYRDSNIGVEVNDEGFISVENADLKKLPEGTIIHYAIAGGHWDYTLRVEKDGFVSIWLRADWGRILIPISQIGKVDFTVGSMNGTLDEESVARMPYFHQTPVGEGDRKLVSVGREAFDATPEDISILLPGGKTFREDAFIRKAEISKLAETIDEIESALVLEAIVPKNRARKIIQIRLMNEHGFSEEDVNQLMALAAKGTSPLQNEPAQAGRSDSELAQKIKALLEKRDAHSSSSGKPVRNTWFSSSVAGYGLFVVVAGVLMIFFGVDLETLSSPLKALLLMAAIPLSMVTTSTMGVAAFYEFSTRRKDPKAWVLKHGVKEGSAEYNAYMESADKIATAGRAATAAGKSAIWAEIKEQSRLNIQYFKVLLFRLGRTPQGPSTEEAPTAISTILQTMPDAKKGTFSAADVFGAVTNTGSDLQAVAKNAVQGMSDQTRGQVSEPASALRWLLKVAGIDTNAVALLPLPSTLLESGDLNQIVDNALAMHKNAVFYVEADVNIPTAFMKHLESKDHRADLVRLPGGVKLFDNQELRMAILEQNSPQNAPNVQPYLPDEYTANDTGVRDEKQFGKKSVLPMSLIIMFNRMIELANFIATQA